MNLRCIPFHLAVGEKCYFMRLKLVHNKNVAVIYRIYLIIYQKIFPSRNAQKNFTRIVRVNIEVRVVQL